MKREFLQNFKVGDQPLPKEIIDAIMAENGRDVENAKKPFADYDTIKGQLSEAQTALQEIQKNGQTLEAAQQKAQEWERKYNDAIQSHQKELADRDFQQKLEAGITGAKGRNAKAIGALLDLDALRSSKNQDAYLKAAIEAVKKDNGYLFDDGTTPPPYAAGTGSTPMGRTYTQEEIANMSMADYRAYRMGKSS